MWLYESVTEVDLKINKAIHKAKHSIMQHQTPDLRENANINAAGQQAIGADVLAESTFLKALENEGIAGTMYSEESGVKQFGKPEQDDPNSIVCILDPLDGSANYLKGIPFGCISLSYGPYQKDPLLRDMQTSSVVSLYSDEEFYAHKGDGAYKNGMKLKSFDELHLPSFDERTIQLSYYAYGSKASQYYYEFEDKYSLRSLGSAAWELALVAENRNDAFVDIRGVLKTHDFAGAKLILEELGGELKFLELTEKEVLDIPLDNFTDGYSVIGSLDHELLEYLINEFASYDMISPKVIG